MDIITYIPDLVEFRKEATENAHKNIKGFTVDHEGRLTYSINKTPVFYGVSGNRSICLVSLLTDEDINIFNNLSTCERLGECIDGEYVFDDGKQSTYEEVKGDLSHTYTIGVFA